MMASFKAPIFFILFGIFAFTDAYYDPTTRYNTRMYYSLSDLCPASRGNDEVHYIDIYSPDATRVHPDVRVLSIESTAGAANFKFERSLTLNRLEVYIIKGRVHRFKVLAPNLRAFTIVDTSSVDWDNDTWHYPKLRVLNLLIIKLETLDWKKVPTFGSEQLEILRLTRIESSSFIFEYSKAFEKLRILEVTQTGLSAFKGICEFIIQLKRLESLSIGNVRDECLFDSLKNLRSFKNLKRIRLYGNNYHYPDESLCLLFPPNIEHLHMSFEAGPEDIRQLKCYSKLKSLMLQLHPVSLPTLETKAHSVYLQSAGKHYDQESYKSLKLKEARNVVLEGIVNGTKSLPKTPMAETLRFNGNGFRFDLSEQIDPFPDQRNVRVLDLSNNPIIVIPSNAFRSLPKLAIVVLQNTPLKYFSDSAFCQLRWPRALNFGVKLPSNVALRDRPNRVNDTESWNSLKCVMDPSREANLIFMEDNCNCSWKPYRFVEEQDWSRLIVNQNPKCATGDVKSMVRFYETRCRTIQAAAAITTPIEKSFYFCENITHFIVMSSFLVFYILFCWIPPVVLFIFHRKNLRRQILSNQRTNPPKSLFIICPKHARKWCKRVIIPCLEADLFSKRAPRLRPIRPPRARNQERNNQNAPDAVNNSSNRRHSLAKSDPDVILPDQMITHNASSGPAPSGVSAGGPQGPWAWQPRFECHMAPPARHRLELMMKSSQVVILFPSPSLFTEPACRAQIRLAFHLCRLGRISPPAIIVWPTNNRCGKMAADYRSVNRDRRRLDEDKYYTAPLFGSISNDPDDVAETAVIKAKVPSREEAVEILQYLSTLTSPCVHWSNMKTVRQNLEPLVWWLNRASQIPAY